MHILTPINSEPFRDKVRTHPKPSQKIEDDISITWIYNELDAVECGESSRHEGLVGMVVPEGTPVIPEGFYRVSRKNNGFKRRGFPMTTVGNDIRKTVADMILPIGDFKESVVLSWHCCISGQQEVV